MKFTFNKTEYELILLNVAGSRLYGNATDKSDYDYRGVFIANPDMHISLNENVEQLGGKTGKGGSGELLCQALLDAGLDIVFTDDIVLYEIRRFIELSLDANPNILDSLSHDSTGESNVYINDLGQKLLDNKNLFMSKKLKHTFSGYAFAQLKKIQSHNKWIFEFPDTSIIIDSITKAYIDRRIDFDFIVQNFGGPLAEEITAETAQEHATNVSNLSWEDFKNIYSNGVDFDKYRVPRLYDYIKAYDLKAKQLNKNEVENFNNTKSLYTIKELLLNHGSFREIGGSMLSLFTKGSGIFDLGGNIKNHPPKEVGDFVCLIIIDKNEYKAQTDHINNMWHWKINRNKERSVLEDEFGYDTKHASHLIRLLLNAMDLMVTGIYKPELSGDTLQMVKDVRAGIYDYENILSMAKKYENKLNDFYSSKECPLPNLPNRVAADKLLIDIIKSFEK